MKLTASWAAQCFLTSNRNHLNSNGFEKGSKMAYIYETFKDFYNLNNPLIVPSFHGYIHKMLPEVLCDCLSSSKTIFAFQNSQFTDIQSL